MARNGIPKQKRAWFSKNDDWIVYDEPKRSADIYIFCLHQSVPATNENVQDPNSWLFWVIATSRIDDELKDQSSVGISTLNQLTEPVAWSEIKETIKQISAV